MGSCCSTAQGDRNGYPSSLDEPRSQRLNPGAQIELDSLPGRRETVKRPQKVLNSIALCALCQSIRWDRLPSEEEPGHAHQPNLESLERSARVCILCAFLLNAVESIRADIDPSTPAISEEQQPREGYISAVTAYPLPFGRTRTETFRYGACPPRFDESSTNAQTQFHQDLISSRFPNGSYPPGPLRPFLFGSWWKLDGSNTADQLIGLGVRLGTTPLIEDAEGNDRAFQEADGTITQRISYQGTYIRVRTGDGKLIHIDKRQMLTLLKDTPLAQVVPGRLRTIETDWGLAFERMQQYVQRCDANHQCVAGDTGLPTRLLDVEEAQDSPRIHLVEMSGQAGSYVTLSHCWGGTVPLRTTIDNYDSHRSDGIDMEDLPAKFRDAVTITRRLGKRYLWIDSLCIIQDDDQDWEREASRMAAVYANSWLTIAAAGSGYTSQGIFNTMDPNLRARDLSPDQISMGNAADPLPFTLRMPDSDGLTVVAREGSFAMHNSRRYGMLSLTNEWMPSSKKSTPQTYCIPYFGADVDVLEGQPLSQRGWTLQERALSPRTVHLATDQIYWECLRGILCEDGSRLKRGPFPVQSVIEKQQLALREESYGLRGNQTLAIAMHVPGAGRAGPADGFIPIEGYPPPSAHAFGRWDGGWLGLVEDFSARNLFRPEDKLPALSGIARAVAEATGDEYLAGLWSNHLAEDLHWRVLERVEIRAQRPGGFSHFYGERFRVPTRLSAYRAPSWSWASLDARVSYIPLDFDRLVVQVLNHHIKRSEIDSFGKVKRGCWVQLEVLEKFDC